jgi:hypothetical protein
MSAELERIEALERQVERLGAKLAAVFETMQETTRAAGLPGEEFRAAARASAGGGHAPRSRPARHLSLVRPSS